MLRSSSSSRRCPVYMALATDKHNMQGNLGNVEDLAACGQARQSGRVIAYEGMTKR
jgi:hypothetical protein